MKKLKDLLELDEDGLYAVRVKNGEISFCTLIPDDHLILSVEAFIDYLKDWVSLSVINVLICYG
ncbi:TPA: hypothetical protein R6O90_001808 [Salmonella enterica subsp. enterica serovar Enteritidis]|nr:hypothetical protein [Salmonella enterica subsp. enterica serovar Enteritidis]